MANSQQQKGTTVIPRVLQLLQEAGEGLQQNCKTNDSANWE